MQKFGFDCIEKCIKRRTLFVKNSVRNGWTFLQRPFVIRFFISLVKIESSHLSIFLPKSFCFNSQRYLHSISVVIKLCQYREKHICCHYKVSKTTLLACLTNYVKYFKCFEMFSWFSSHNYTNGKVHFNVESRICLYIIYYSS